MQPITDALTDLQWSTAHGEVISNYSDKDTLQQTSRIPPFDYFQSSGIWKSLEMQNIADALTDLQCSTAHGEVISHYSNKDALQQTSQIPV